MLFFWLIVWGVSIWASIEVGTRKGRQTEGIVLGILLGLIGLLIVFALPPGDGHVPIPASSARSRQPTTIAGRLQALDDLRHQGLITDAEYARKRAALLDEV